MISVKSEADLVKMRVACKITGDTLKMIEKYVQPGVTTKELDTIIEDFIRKSGGTPNFKHLYGFPASACISIDDVVVHGNFARAKSSASTWVPLTAVSTATRQGRLR